MPFITNRFQAFFIFLIAGASVLLFQIQDASAQSANFGQKKMGAARDQNRLTPEERAAENQKVLQAKNELAMRRMQEFGTLPAGDDSELGKAYLAAFNRFREATVDLNQVQINFHLATDFSQPFRNRINQEWRDKIHDSNVAKENWIKAASEVYSSDPEKYVTLGETLCEMLLADVELDRMDGWLEAAKAIVNAKKLDREEVLVAAGLVAYANSDFDFTEECINRSQGQNGLPVVKPRYIAEIDSLRQKWVRELEFRRQEAEKNDNPRVELLTSKGRMLVELYEDAAPETVKSFIYLIEAGYFNRKTFFRVEKHVCAQTGCEKGDGTGNAGYTIANESERPDHRDHFRGSLAIALGADAKTGQVIPESGGAQFYFAFLPMPHLDGKHTVFGRVVEGQETMNFFRVMNLSDAEQRKDTSKNPDLILSAKVVRKRDTVYRPKVIAGKLYK